MSKVVVDNILMVSRTIQTLVDTHQIDYIDACILYCEQTGLEIEYVGEIIEKNQVLRAKIEKEAEELNFLKKQNRIF
jgi:hypothetical protein